SGREGEVRTHTAASRRRGVTLFASSGTGEQSHGGGADHPPYQRQQDDRCYHRAPHIKGASKGFLGSLAVHRRKEVLCRVTTSNGRKCNSALLPTGLGRPALIGISVRWLALRGLQTAARSSVGGLAVPALQPGSPLGLVPEPGQPTEKPYHIRRGRGIRSLLGLASGTATFATVAALRATALATTSAWLDMR